MTVFGMLYFGMDPTYGVGASRRTLGRIQISTLILMLSKVKHLVLVLPLTFQLWWWLQALCSMSLL